MWELDYKKSWVPKNWWFWTVVLEMTLEGTFDSKEIQSVHLQEISSGDLSNSQCGLPWWAIKTSFIAYWSLSFQFSSVIQFCLTLCNRKDCSTPGFPVYHQLPEFTQTHVYWVGDSIQPSHSVIPFSSTNHAWVHNWLVMTSWVSVVVRAIYLLLPN